jgi:hypothetical protein
LAAAATTPTEPVADGVAVVLKLRQSGHELDALRRAELQRGGEIIDGEDGHPGHIAFATRVAPVTRLVDSGPAAICAAGGVGETEDGGEGEDDRRERGGAAKALVAEPPVRHSRSGRSGRLGRGIPGDGGWGGVHQDTSCHLGRSCDLAAEAAGDQPLEIGPVRWTINKRSVPAGYGRDVAAGWESGTR